MSGAVDEEILHHAEIGLVLREHMPGDEWVPLEQIYELVEAHVELTAADLAPATPTTTSARWKRNVRNFLQSAKDSDEFDWDGMARYRYHSSVNEPLPAAIVAGELPT